MIEVSHRQKLMDEIPDIYNALDVACESVQLNIGIIEVLVIGFEDFNEGYYYQ